MLSAEDVVAIHALLADYGHVVDDHDRDRAHEVFAEDVVFERGDGRADTCTASPTSSPPSRAAPGTPTSRRTRRSARTPTARRAHRKFIGFPNEGPPVTGDYRDVVVRTPQGWRLRHRHAEVRARKFFD